jgi:hypothetical protein
MSDSTNYGIAGSDIKITATNLVVGPHGRIDARGAQDLTAHLDALTRAIALHDGPPEAREQLTAATAEIAAELQEPAPDKSKLTARLTTIGVLAGTATAVAGAATGLLAAVEALF